MISVSRAKEILLDHGFIIEKIKYIPEGANHYVFDIQTNNSQSRIVKFTKNTLKDSAPKRDSLFNGIVSQEREIALCDIIRKNGNLPVPKIFYTHESDDYEFVVVEKMPGISWQEYIMKNNDSKEIFYTSLKRLGEKIADLQKIKFDSFGDIMSENKILPSGVYNFSERFLQIMEFRIEKACSKDIFSETEKIKITEFLKEKLDEIYFDLDITKVVPVMVFTDMHGENFLVDENGNPTGFFDLESCQAAHPSLEFYGLKFFLFNHFNDLESFKNAEKYFFEGFNLKGGNYNFNNKTNRSIEDLQAALRLIELTESYYGVKDGVRDEWSRKLKDILFRYVFKTHNIDYLEIGKILREKFMK